jgi:hypothetical protein
MNSTIYRAIIASREQNNLNDLKKMGFEFIKNELPVDNTGEFLMLFQHEKRKKSFLYADFFKIEDFIDKVTYPCIIEEKTTKVTKKQIAWLQYKVAE